MRQVSTKNRSCHLFKIMKISLVEKFRELPSFPTPLIRYIKILRKISYNRVFYEVYKNLPHAKAT